MSPAFTIVVAWLWVAAPTPPDESVLRAADRAAAYVREGRYDDAVAVIEEASRSKDHPVFIYVRGIIEEERGHCTEAIEYYDAYLALDVPDVDAREAGRRKERCVRLLEAARENAPAASPDPAPDPEPPRDDGLDDARWYADPAGVTLLVVGAAGLAAGAGLHLQARADERAAERAQTVGAYDRLAGRAESLSRWGIATMSVGGALLVAGIVRYAVVGARAAKHRRRDATVRVRFRGPTVALTF